MAERKQANLFAPNGANTPFSYEAFPTKVDIFDSDGDLCISIEVPHHEAPDPLELAEKGKVESAQVASVTFPLVTAGRDPGIDALAIMQAVLNPLSVNDRVGVFGWLQSRYKP